jgi:phytanoyl-CoA hydroxylase
VCFFF